MAISLSISIPLLCFNFFMKIKLIDILQKNFCIKATINKRTNLDGAIKWRINISILSMDKLISIVQLYIIPEMLYKLVLKKSDKDNNVFCLLPFAFCQVRL